MLLRPQHNGKCSEGKTIVNAIYFQRGRSSLILPVLLLVTLTASSNGTEPSDLAHHPWLPPFGLKRVGAGQSSAPLEAAALARAEKSVHPVDQGLIFVPDGWLVLSHDQTPVVTVAVISHAKDLPNARIRAWFDSTPKRIHSQSLKLARGRRTVITFKLDPPNLDHANDTLHVAILESGGKTLWNTGIRTMLVKCAPRLPAFGATALKLRYDLPIVINQSENGKIVMDELVHRKYNEGWDKKLNDVVVSLPNGSRFVFWRGACYIPFWAGPNNTGLCYEWAETRPPPGAFVDSIEPLMDKELRYSNVEIIESTPARVHVRWTYQSVSFKYEVFGDQTIEDYYFYPDGFGTRTLRLKKRPAAPYELSEFIVLSAPGMYPLSFVPEQAAEMIYLDDGTRHEFHFPPLGYTRDQQWPDFKPPRQGEVLYRIRSHVDDSASAIYFHPSKNHFPKSQYRPFYDGKAIVTPGYWGSHWPLARGKMTGGKIDPLITQTPSHTSLLTWAFGNYPEPEFRGKFRTLNALGESVEMSVETYAWLIGMTDIPDARLLEWGRSYAYPPAITIDGGTLRWNAYNRTRRAIRLTADDSDILIHIKPGPITVNPVFEILSEKKKLASITLDGKLLPPDCYAWDGKTLWIKATFSEPKELQLKFVK